MLSSLIEKTFLDGATVFMAALSLGIVTSIAVALPAWRATTVNPISALRDE
jgi:ABC-type antimicrobial peptide transport system permease subunit